jgi:hypothetical protein
MSAIFDRPNLTIHLLYSTQPDQPQKNDPTPGGDAIDLVAAFRNYLITKRLPTHGSAVGEHPPFPKINQNER